MRRLVFLALALVCCAGASRVAAQQPDTADLERRAQLERQAAGFRVGYWKVKSLDELAGIDESAWPLLEGYYQRGLDLHLAVESSIGLWRREVVVREAGIGSATRERSTVYVVPLLTALKLYPFTRPDAGFQPFVLGGAGFALGIAEHAGESTLLGSGEGTNVFTGFGLKTALGAEWRFSNAMGAAAAVRWQWIRFGDPVAGERTYAGPAVDVGLTYRFQY